MAVHLSDEDIGTIVGILDGWPSGKKLIWQSLIDECYKRLGHPYTRQAFARYDRIKRAYKIKKQNVQHGAGKFKGKSIELQKALERIERLQSENKRLNAENQALLEQFARYTYNAHIKNVDEKWLNQPLPKIDRQRTKI